MEIKFKTEVKAKPWVKNPRERWNYGLMRAGQVGWKGSLQKYPRKYGPDAGGYKRTGALGNKADFRIVSLGQVMHFLGTFYTTFALFGTGIYGPKARPIRPVKAKFLAWKSTGRGQKKITSGTRTIKGREHYSRKKGFYFTKDRVVADKRKDTYLVFAREVRGYIWDGKLEAVKEAIIQAFNRGVKNYRGEGGSEE